MYYSSPGRPQEPLIIHWSACTPVCSALYILVCFILIIFSLTLKLRTQCAQIVIYPEMSHWGAWGSSRTTAVNEWNYAWSVCKVHCQNTLTTSSVSIILCRMVAMAKLNHKCTELANYKPHFARYWLSSMLGPVLPNPKMASATSCPVKRAGAWEQISGNTDSAQQLCKMAGN